MNYQEKSPGTEGRRPRPAAGASALIPAFLFVLILIPSWDHFLRNELLVSGAIILMVYAIHARGRVYRK